jgi:hypothetical protein
MKTTIWVCDGPCTTRVESFNMPQDWFDLSSGGTMLGCYCPECSTSVNVPLFLKAREDERNRNAASIAKRHADHGDAGP